MSNSLRDLDRVEDRIRQHRQVDNSPILIVEGPDDLLMLRVHLDRVAMFAADGKTNVLTAVAALKGWGQVGIRAVVDADFDDDLDPGLESTVHAYEGRDLEAMLVSLGVLELILEHLGSSAKLNAVGGVAAAAEVVIAATKPLTEIRHVNRMNGWGLRFDAVDATSKTDRRSLIVDVRRYAASLVAASDTTVVADEIVRALEEVSLDGRGPRGKDVAALAGLALRAKFGSLPHTAADADLIATHIRASGGLALAQSHWLGALRDSLIAAEQELNNVAA